MCLAVPGQIIEILDHADVLPQARVSFGGIVKQICLAYTPDATVGCYILAHAGFALSVIDEIEAQRIQETFDNIPTVHP